MAVVIYVPKKEIAPAFGWANRRTQTAYVRADLPLSIRNFVAAHELYHLRDDAIWWVWREIKANVYAFFRHPIGGIGCIAMSLFSLERLKMYWKRFREGK